MGLLNIKKKDESIGKSKSSVLKINMYENPQMALDLIAHICTASRDLDVDHCFDDYERIINELDEKINTQGYTLIKDNLFESCRNVVNYLIISLLTDVEANIKIAVAGGFSAGKSSLLNALTGIGDMLPTGIEPVSMVNTHLNCSTSIKNLIVRGENLKNDVVLLNKDVLACVQHASKSKVYVASVLNRIILDVPTPNHSYLNGVRFIDTPGYDNSFNINKENKTKDVDTALEAIKDSDVLFWCIDIEKGTIPDNDLQMLRQVQQQYEDMPLVIFFTKMDKKASEVKNIMKTASTVCENGLLRMPDDIIGVSCVDNTVEIKSLNNYSINDVFKIIRSANGTSDYLQIAEELIDEWLDNEINASNKTADDYEEDRQKSIKEKQEWQQIYNDYKKDNKEEIDHIKDVLITSYDEIMHACDKRLDILDKAIKGWSDALDREVEWSNKAGMFSDTSSLSRKYENAIDQYNRLIKTDLGYQYYYREHRESVCKDFEKLLNKQLEEIKRIRDEEENNAKELINKISAEAELRQLINEYRPVVINTLRENYNACKKLIQEHMNKLQGIRAEEDSDVFSAIHSDNYKRFLACFSIGVDMKKFDAEGYSPLTLACKVGNNEMIKFFIEHEVDLAQKDGRGYNALETAAIYNFRDICELLYEADKSLVKQSASLVELSKQNAFSDWVSKL